MIRMLRDETVPLVLAGLAALAPLPGGSAGAQIVNHNIVKNLSKDDLTTLRPIISDLLSKDAVGGTRDWHSPSGKQGKVKLLAGGARAGLTTGTVDILYGGASQAASHITFKYGQDAKGVWRTTG